jgi:hypothetical protein
MRAEVTGMYAIVPMFASITCIALQSDICILSILYYYYTSASRILGVSSTKGHTLYLSRTLALYETGAFVSGTMRFLFTG